MLTFKDVDSNKETARFYFQGESGPFLQLEFEPDADEHLSRAKFVLIDPAYKRIEIAIPENWLRPMASVISEYAARLLETEHRGVKVLN